MDLVQFEYMFLNRFKLYCFRLLDSKRIIGRASGWETFYITGALRRWVNDVNKVHHLEVLIENISEETFDETVSKT